MRSMTITVDAGGLRVGYDLLDDAGPEEIQDALETLLNVARSSRFRALAAAMRQFQPSPSATVPTPAPVASVPAVAAPVGVLVGGNGNGHSDHFEAFDVGGVPDFDGGAVGALPTPSDPAGVFEFRSVEKKSHTETGEITWRAMPTAGDHVKFGIKLPDSLRAEYFKRAGLAGDLPVGVHSHRSVFLKVGDFQKDGKTYPKLESFYDHT